MSTENTRGNVDAAAENRRPPGLIVATLVVGLEALTLLGFAGWLVLRHGSEVPSNEQVYSGSVVYLVVFGAMVAIVAASLWKLRGWAFGAAVFMQVLALPIAWQMGGAGFWLGAVPLAMVAVVAVIGLMSGPARLVLGRSNWDDDDKA